MSALPALPAKPLHFGAASLRLRRLDRHTRLTFAVIKKAIRRWKADRPGVQKVRPPREWGRLPLITLPFAGDDVVVTLPTKDEDWPPSDHARTIMLRLLRSPWLFPIRDDATAWVDPQEGRDAFQELLPLGAYMSRPYHVWTDVRGDATMSRLAFAGLASLRLILHTPEHGQPDWLVDAKWVSEFGYLGGYEVRPGFERYGARAFFDDENFIIPHSGRGLIR